MALLGRIRGNNYILVHLFVPWELGALFWILSIYTDGLLRRSFLLSIPLFATFWLISHLFWEDWSSFNGPSLHLEQILVLLGAMCGIYRASTVLEHSLADQPLFWIAIAAFFDMLISILPFLFLSWLRSQAPEARAIIGVIRTVLEGCVYLIFARAFFCDSSQPTAIKFA
jgi:hypothetical protein